jgi:hypothetical protein
MKMNCWQFKKCGREPGGPKVKEFGVCPVITVDDYDGVNGGHNGGRYCWRIAGTLCEGKVQGTFAAKFMNCLTCDFFKQVQAEEGLDLCH